MAPATRAQAAGAGAGAGATPALSILLPTYNERENLPLVLWLIERHLVERCGVRAVGGGGGGHRDRASGCSLR